ncbi:MAG TPA: amidohydrolase, partial [Bacteroidales bacterium]|nr:amidohydrolase [Bacteroidales bacterium]
MNDKLLSEVSKLQPEMKEWMDFMHQNPELNMDTQNTAKFIAEKLKLWGYDVVEGVGGSGIVASLTVGKGTKSIGLRADFDALPIFEDNDLPYKSKVEGWSHLCGHDAHATMLLGAAKYMADNKNFDGTIRLIFQPGE